MINHPDVQKILYGGDYNPEQWDKDIWEEDMRLLKLAHIDIVTLNVFNWAGLQKDETTYDFSVLDQIIALVTKNGMKICLATATGAHPAWMAKKYPDVLRVEFSGMKRKFGGRQNSCPNSPTFQKYSPLMAEKLAEHYQNQTNIVSWHISNEYGGACYCENCEKAFRVWLKEKYKTIEALNHEWVTTFWGHTFYDWDEIVAPNMLSEHHSENRTSFQGISLDYARFNSDSILENFKAEYKAIKKYMPAVPITTNFMDMFKTLDYQKWAPYLDFISWDSYPAADAPIAKVALNHDLMRGLKGGMPFALMEQTPSVTNWMACNTIKRPGVLRLWSYQAVAHGADTIMYFQLRRSLGSCEKFHGAVIDHVGNENTRAFRECTELGEEFQKIGAKTLGSRMQSKAAIVFDWNNWWAIEYSTGPNNELRYASEVFNYYQALHSMNISVDIVSVTDDLSGYQLVVAPVLYMIKPGFDQKLKEFVKNGGTFVTTFFSGIVNENDRVTAGGYPGKIRDLLGIWVEEIDSLSAEQENSFVYGGKKYPAKMLCDIMHCETAEQLSAYEQDFYQNTPVLTCNQYGKGKAYYVATSSSTEFYADFLKDICQQSGVKPVLNTPQGVEATRRIKGDTAYTFILNHGNTETGVKLDSNYTDLISGTSYQPGSILKLSAKGVAILESILN